MIAPLPPELLARMRETTAATFDRTATVLRPGAAVPDGAGGRTRTEAPAGAYPCRLGPVTRRLAETLAARGVVLAGSEQAATLQYGADVRGDDRIAIDGTRFEVVHVAPPASLQTALTVIVRRG